MAEKKLLSVIVPSYNMEAYLPKCLESLVIAPELMSKLEVWVVNDGSKDSTPLIGKHFESRYPGIFHLIDKPNGNYGSCINAALKSATGKYLKVLDADDWFDTQALTDFIGELDEIDTDLVLTDFTRVDLTTSIDSLVTLDLPADMVIDVDKTLLPQFQMHAVAYRTDLLRQIGYTQTEGISYTDQEWIFFPMFVVKTAIYLHLNLYQYVIGRPGQTMNFDALLRNHSHSEKILRRMTSEFTQSAVTPGARRDFLLQALYLRYRYFFKISLLLLPRSKYEKSTAKEFYSMASSIGNDFLSRINRLPMHKFAPFPYVKIWKTTGLRFAPITRHFLKPL